MLHSQKTVNAQVNFPFIIAHQTSGISSGFTSTVSNTLPNKTILKTIAASPGTYSQIGNNVAKNILSSIPSVKPTKESISEEIVRLLTTNPLPPYIAPPVPAKFKEYFPSNGFKCKECGDTYMFESSLQQHMQRRSIRINYPCDVCNKAMLFYNRCSFLFHIHSHKSQILPNDLQKVELSSLPKEMLQEELVSTSTDGIEQNSIAGPPKTLPMILPGFTPITGASSIIIMQNNLNQTTITPVSNVITTISNTNNNNSIITNGTKLFISKSDANSTTSTDVVFKCFECSQMLNSWGALEAHFSRSQNMPLAASQCPKCNMTCPSKCSLAAHQRIHTRSKPYVCPECGVKPSVSWTAFHRHLMVSCFHYSRTLGHKCPSCNQLFGPGNLLRTHVITMHGESYYKCQACPMAFKTESIFESHKKTAHMNVEAECKLIHKCPLCDTVFQDWNQLQAHTDKHINVQIRATKFLFKCMECTNFFETKPELSEHMNLSHPEVIRKELCNYCGISLDNFHQLQAHLKAEHKVTVSQLAQSSGKDNDKPLGKPEVNEDVKSALVQALSSAVGGSFAAAHPVTSSTNIDSPPKVINSDDAEAPRTCLACGEVCSSQGDLFRHGQKHLENNVNICLLCRNYPYTHRSNLMRHLDSHAMLFEYPTPCQICDVMLTDKVTTCRHLRTEHMFGQVICPLCSALYLSLSSLSLHITSKHGYSGDQIQFGCYLCKVTKNDYDALESHLVTDHKVSGIARAQIKVTVNQTLTSSADSNSTVDKPSSTEDTPIKKKRVLNSGSTGSLIEKKIKVELMDDNEAKAATTEKEKKEVIPQLAENRSRVCVKCDFVSSKKDVFIEHIRSHKKEKDSYQCLECGTCFVVEPGLEKHLIITHKIRDAKGYMAREGSEVLGNGVDFAGKSGRADSTDLDNFVSNIECEVCHRVFDSEAVLKFHMRTHGMAFIQSKRVGTGNSSDSNSN